ncbi:MAG TPA: hypothetical protein VGX24_02160 [Pyrinomonadaceae bacterium]|nr:hypothetical protein [Pyrinomonadaceae bacterium]
MENRRASKSIFVVGFVSVACVFLLAANSVQAQQTTPGGPPPPGNRDPFGEARDRQQREAQLRSAEMMGMVKMDRRAAAAAAEQLKEDFRNIQILRNKLVRHLQSDKPLDYKFIASETGEINKRAGRLKTHLLRLAPEAGKTEQEKKEQEQVEIEDGQMSVALVKMCRRIDSFTESPVFKVPDVIDLKQSDKAGRDLRDIIRLSAGIKRVAERLHKTDRK